LYVGDFETNIPNAQLHSLVLMIRVYNTCYEVAKHTITLAMPTIDIMHVKRSSKTAVSHTHQRGLIDS